MNRLVKYIRRKSREEWQKEIYVFVAEMRDWIQRNGELAAAIGFLVGVAIVLEFRIVLSLVLLFAFAAFMVWQIALPEATLPPPEKTPAKARKTNQT